MRSQLDVGENVLRTGVAPRIALVGTKHETAAEQHYLPRPTEVADNDGDVNTFRGKVKPIFDSMLDTYSEDAWFAFADPRIHRSIVVMHLKGMKNGKRRRWWQNETSSLVTEFEIVFGVAPADYRNAVKNPGQ